MRTEQRQWSPERGWEPDLSATALGASAEVVYLFGSASAVTSKGCFEGVRRAYPNAHVFGCSTAGVIQGARVMDDALALTAVAFDRARVGTARAAIESTSDSRRAGEELARQFDPRGLRHVFVLLEGLKVNASELVAGLDSGLPPGVTASGGCAADGNRLQTTYVWCDGEPEQGSAVALGFYGDDLKVGVAAFGGWRPFGPDRLITKAKDNVLYEFDGRPALALYKQYLGTHAEGLPASGLMFPLELRIAERRHAVLRALLSVDEGEQSITFAGDVPEGAYARFMLGKRDDLIEGTHTAAAESKKRLGGSSPELSLLVSCNGRRFILKQRVEEEVEAAEEALGEGVPMTGFYSYGEIAPAEGGTAAELHNETMTITSFSERT